jgi:CelD/BcsL family acetyltransferase involved in cellulose biosynthesis
MSVAAAGATVSVRTELGPDAPVWDELVIAAPLPSPFLRSWWLSAMAGPESRFLLVREGQQLIGGLAVNEIRRAGLTVLRPLGADGLAPDHLDVLAAPGAEDRVIVALRRWLSRPSSRLVDFPGVVENSRFAGLLGPRAESVVIEQAPWVELPSDFETFTRTTLPGIMKNSLRRSGNKLARVGEVAFTPLTAADPRTPAVLTRLRELHAVQFGADSGLIREFERFRATVEPGLVSGELKVFPLFVGETIAAVDVAFSVAGRFSYYQGGRSMAPEHSGAGTVLMGRGVEWACSTGHSEVDFLRGEEPYKEQWSDRRRNVLRLRAGFGPAGVLAQRALQAREDERVRRYGRKVKSLLRRGAQPAESSAA